MKYLLQFLGLVATMTVAQGTAFYVDNAQTGASNGLSWATAWPSFTNVVWASINPGDTLYISGGTATSAKVYNSTLMVGKSGTSDAARVTISTGQDSGHNGTVIVSGNYFDLSGRSYVTVTGNVGGQQRMRFINFFSPTERTDGNPLFAPSSTGCTFEYLTASNVNQVVSAVGCTKIKVQYITATDVKGDAAVRLVNCFGPVDANLVQNNDFTLSRNISTGYGPDGVQGSSGITVRSNRFTVANVSYATSGQHTDYTQIIGNDVRIYANDFLNVGDSCIDMDFWANPNPSNIWIYNNVFRMTATYDPFPDYIRLYASSSRTINSITGLKIFNNTFADNNVNAAIYLTWGANPNVQLSGCEIKNNIFAGCAGFYVLDNPQLSNGGLVIANNTYAPSYNMYYRGVTYTPAGFGVIDQFRIVGTPSFISYSPFAPANNFHLLGSDVSAKGRGLTLSTYFTTDKDYITRTTPWDNGAYAYVGGTPSLPPNTPSNVTPASGATGVSLTPTLTSSTYSDPTSLAHQASQFRILTNVGTAVVWDSGPLAAVTSTAVPATKLTYQTTYNWQVRYQNTLGLWSAYSTPTTFTTLLPSAPNAPTNVTPADSATDVELTPYLTASAFSDPNGSTQLASQWLLYNGTNVIDSGNFLPVTTYHVPVTLSNLTAYTWTVRYQNAYGLWSPLSASTIFVTTNSTVLPPPPPPPPPPVAPGTPANVIPANGGINISLQPILRATPYTDTQGSPQAASQWVLSRSNVVVLDSGRYAAATNYPVTQTLSNNNTYTWTTRYQNALGLWSPYSTATGFTTTNIVIPPPPPPPTTNPPVILPSTADQTIIFRGTVTLQGTFISQ